MKSLKTMSSLLLLVIMIAAGTFSPARAQEGSDDVQIHITQVDISSFPQVTLYLSVTDAMGEAYGIDPSQLHIAENGVSIDAARIEGMESVGRLSTLLVLDVSGSMNVAGKLEAAQAAANAYIDTMRPGDQVGLVTFNTDVTYVQPLTQDADLLRAAVDSLRAEEDTAMYDALLQGVAWFEETGGRKAIIVLTDGLDNRSTVEQDDVLDAIGPGGLTISTVGLGDPDQGDATNAGLDVPGLMNLAAGAGGQFSYANDEESLTALYTSLARTLQSEYILTYTSPSELRDGFGRELTVTLLDQPASVQNAGYNPGGLIPEVGEGSSFALFVGATLFLTALLFLPQIVSLAGSLRDDTPPEKTRPKIRFTD